MSTWACFYCDEEETHLGKSAWSIPPHLKLHSPHVAIAEGGGQPRKAFLNHVPLHLWPLLIRWGSNPYFLARLWQPDAPSWEIGLGLRLEGGHINGKVLPTLAAVSTTASKAPLLEENPEATGKQKASLQKEADGQTQPTGKDRNWRPPGPWDTNPVTSAFQCQERHHKKWTECYRIKLPGFKSQPWHLPV